MKNILLCLALGVVVGAAACSTVDSRVKGDQAAFNSWPVDVQNKVRAGKVDMGFGMEMVRVALGEPDRVVSRTTSRGAAEVWIYFDRGPKFSFGFGLGAVRGSSAYAGAVNVGNDWRDNEVLRVIFEGGRVSAIETRR